MAGCRSKGPTLAALALLASGIWAISAIGAEPEGPIGFLPASRAAQAKAEAFALTVPTPEQARATLRLLTKDPHVAGTKADRRLALDVRNKLRSWGWTADLAEYEVLLNYPVEGSVALEMLRPTPKKLRVVEEPLLADKDSDHPDAFPAFNGYGVSGDVKGQVVYANYGWDEDFEALEKLGIDIRGKIVLVRYGALFRGLKVRNASKHGAKGILMYSDPAEDGYTQGDVYPNGPFRPGSAIQRGSVHSLAERPGDPSTPDGPSTRGARRLPIDPRHGFPLGGDGEAAWEKETGLVRDDYFAEHPVAADRLRRREADPGGARRAERPGGVARRAPPALSHRAGAGGGPFLRRDGLQGPPDLERHRHLARQGRARPLGDGRQPPGRLGLRRGRSRQRHRLHIGDVPRPGRGRQARLGAAPDDRLCELGRRGIRPRRLDGMGRGPRRGAFREGDLDAERRRGRQRPAARPGRRPFPARLRARRRLGRHRRPFGPRPARRLARPTTRPVGGGPPDRPRRSALGRPGGTGRSRPAAPDPPLLAAAAPPRLRLGLHRLPRPPGHPRARHQLLGEVRGLSLDV